MVPSFPIKGKLGQPPLIAFGGGSRPTPVPGSVQHNVVFSSHRTPTDYVDFLVNSGALQECLQGGDTTRIR